MPHVLAHRGITAIISLALPLGICTPSVAVSDWLFPSDNEMRQTIGLRTDRYEFPWRNVMNRENGYRHTRCSPRYARNALSVGAWSYNFLNGPYGGSLDITLWKYPGSGLAFKAVNKHRRQMSHCKNYRLYPKKVKNDGGFPIKTSGVNGSPGQLRMRNKFGDVVDSAEREWMTAVGKYVVQVEAVYWGNPRPPFPPVTMNRDVTSSMEDLLVTDG